MSENSEQAGAGQLYVISAPSGAGKSSLVERLVENERDIVVSVSHTTRSARAHERSGEHYFFVDEAGFLAMAAEGAFLEHAHVFGNYYGTSQRAVEEALGKGLDVVLEIDWQGAGQVRRVMPGCIGIFVLPPNAAALAERLRGRGQDSESVIEHRLRQARDDASHYGEFDYIVVNDDFESAARDLSAIVRAERLREERQARRHRALLTELLAS